MEKESMIKTSVAELAGKFTSQKPFPPPAEGNKPVRKRPPRTLQLPVSSDAGLNQDEQKGEVTSHPPRRNKNSAFIEKLQANIARSPTAHMPSPLSPGAVKPYPSPFSSSPCSPCSPPAVLTPSEEEIPASFETPVEGKILQSINKGRARHSIKRRPPSRRQKKNSGDEADEEKTAPSGQESTPSGAGVEGAVERQNVKAEETDGAIVGPSTSPHQSEPNESAAPVSEQQSPAGGESQACEETSTLAEEQGKADEGESRDESQLASSCSVSSEPETQSEHTADEVREEQEERREEEGGDQEKQTKGSEQ